MSRIKKARTNENSIREIFFQSVSDLFYILTKTYDFAWNRMKLEEVFARARIRGCIPSRAISLYFAKPYVCTMYKHANGMFIRATFRGTWICNTIYANTYLLKSIRRDLGHPRPSLHLPHFAFGRWKKLYETKILARFEI